MALNIFGEALTLYPCGTNSVVYTGGYNGNSESVAKTVTGVSEVTKSGIRRTQIAVTCPVLKINDAATPAVIGSYGDVRVHVVIAHPQGNLLTNLDHPTAAASEYTDIGASVYECVRAIVAFIDPLLFTDSEVAPSCAITDPIVRASIGMNPIDSAGSYGQTAA